MGQPASITRGTWSARGGSFWLLLTFSHQVRDPCLAEPISGGFGHVVQDRLELPINRAIAIGDVAPHRSFHGFHYLQDRNLLRWLGELVTAVWSPQRPKHPARREGLEHLQQEPLWTVRGLGNRVRGDG